MTKDEFSFQNNQELEFVYLANIRSQKRNGPFELTMKKLPKTLKYIDLYMASLIIKNEIFFNSLKDVFCIIIRGHDPLSTTLQVDEEYLKKHQNIKIQKDFEEILPGKYQRKQMYGLFGIDPQ
jgi:hypothetical protein